MAQSANSGLDEAAALLSRARSINDIAASLRHCARAIASADGITFVLREGELCHYVAEDAIGPLWAGQRFPLTSCISGWAMLNAQTVVIRNIAFDVRIPHALYRTTFVSSLVMAPVGHGTPQAAIGAYWAKTGAIAPLVITRLEALADKVAEAMERLTPQLV